MSEATLNTANMTNANVSNTNLNTATVEETDMQDIIYNDFTEFPILDDAINVPEELFEPRNQAPRDAPGVAYEIHNVFNKIDIDGYLAILKEAIPSIQTSGPNGNFKITDIDMRFEQFIVEHFPENERTSAIYKLKAIMRRLTSSGELSANGAMKLVSDTVEFVIAQPSKFQEFYLNAFIQDCYHAYTNGVSGAPFTNEQGMSCVKGIIERFVWIVGDTVQAMCTEVCDNPIYEQLLKVFGKNKLDINELTQEWDAEVLQKPEFQDKTAITKEQVRRNFIEFMKDKYSAVGMWIPNTQALVNKRAEELDYAFENRMFGGSLRNRRNRRKKTMRRRRKSQHKKKVRKQTLKCARKNATKKR
jgi:hypothetical protein